MIEINNLTTNPVDEEFLKKTAKIVLGGEHLPKGRVVAELRSRPRKGEQERAKTLSTSSRFAGARVPEEVELSIALVGQGRIRELNKKYLGKNRATDVMAFGQNQKPKIKNQKLNELGLGEVVICLREVKKNAKRYGTTFEKELAKVLIHGILHLLGYDHEESTEAAQKMQEKEERYLSQIISKSK